METSFLPTAHQATYNIYAVLTLYYNVKTASSNAVEKCTRIEDIN